MSRRKSSAVEDIVEIGGMLPWWLSLFAAALAYWLLNVLAQIEPGVATGTNDMASVMVRTLVRTVAHYAQYVVPALLLFGALLSAVKGFWRARVYDSVAGSGPTAERKPRDRLDTVTWRQFEGLVHEYFHRHGYSVAETAEGPDGGIDLRLTKVGRTATVQCKHWRKKKVDVKIVREQLGVMTANRADECFVVTSGAFTDEARDFAVRQPISLIDGEDLRKLMGIFAWDHIDTPSLREPTIACPSCGSKMIMRTARRGRNAGTDFWGCSRYPKCRGTRQPA